jgi:hypothetical protein
MVNYQPDLQGWADRDEDPEWMENALARVRARQKKTRVSTQRNNPTCISYDDPFRVMLNEAADRRDISLNAYIRRATAAFIAHDLGMPFTEVVRHTAKPKARNPEQMTFPDGRTFDDGLGMGPWLIEGLRELR